MCLSSLLPLFPRSNFTLGTTPLSSEFAPITLHIGQWFLVVKSVFSSIMSPMQTFLDILTHFWRSCKFWINSFLHLLQNSLLRCWILLYLLLQYKSGLWKTTGGDITTFAFIVSILFGDIGIGLCPSLIPSHHRLPKNLCTLFTMSCVVMAPLHSQISDLAFLWQYHWIFTFTTESWPS